MMKLSLTTLALFVALLPADLVEAFSAGKSRGVIRTAGSSSSKLHVGASWSLDDAAAAAAYDYDSAASSDHMMHRAQACATNSDSCSLEEAQLCLTEVLHIQQNCMSAGVLSTSAEVCGVDTYDSLPGIVDVLRQRIASEQQRLAVVKAGMHVLNVMLGTFIVAMILHGIVADPNVPVDAANGAVVSFLPMEVVYSIRDGYFPLLMKEWMQHGGLVVDPSVFEAKAVPITGQEWTMAGDALPRLLQEQIQYGGLRVDTGYDGTTTEPLQLQEWWWAVRDGYALQAVQHVLRNGGL